MRSKTLLLTLAILLAGLAPVRAADVAAVYPQVRQFFPEADRFGEFEGEPRAAPIYRGERLLGYALLSNDVVRIPAYSGKPINTLIGFDLAGRIVGVSIVQHEEPILVIGITDERLRRFADQYRGKSVFDRVAVGAPRPGHLTVDTISGATITVMVENATIMRAARRVAESRGVRLPAAAEAPASTPAPGPLTAEPPAVAAAPADKPAPPAFAPRAEQAPQVPAAVLLPREPKASAAGPGIAPPAPAPAAASPVAAGRPAVPLELEEPLWKNIWQERRIEIAALIAGLVTLTTILVLQDWFARRPKLLFYVRRGFLLYTVLFIGWYALAQLSVVNVFTFLHAFMRDFHWENFLIDPMLFILWGFVALTLLLWGRGVYCGWLCPFGAIQELLGQAARQLGVRQFEFPHVVHERLWAVKYIILIMLFGLSLQSLGEAVRYAEVEPFKTAVTLHFQREWPFVLYAAGLIAISVFNRKFFCKYACPLGAALSIPGRFRVFDWWLRRRKECGRPCQTCANDCEVSAIRQTGEINANECHYCLDCQVTYYNQNKCMPLIERRKKHERSIRAAKVVRMEVLGRGDGSA